jgi:hypothetical protein
MLCVVMCTGCSSLTGDTSKGKKKDSTWPWMKKKEYQIPQSVNVTWTHDIFTAEGKPPTRGFGGRLYFYNERSQAIPVEGELTVFGFDDTQRDHSGMEIESADKRFKFTAEQFTRHFSESELGASYSIWIPWDAAPGEAKKIMLIPTFRGKDGRLIKGKPASLLLPGPPGSDGFDKVIQASAKGPASQANRSNPAPSATAPSYSNQGTLPTNTPRTTTLQMPRHMQARPQLPPDRAAALLQQALEANLNQQQQAAAAAAHTIIPPIDSAVVPASATVPANAADINSPGPNSVDGNSSNVAGWSINRSTGAAINLSGSLPVRSSPGGLPTARPFRIVQPAGASANENAIPSTNNDINHEAVNANGNQPAWKDAPVNQVSSGQPGPTPVNWTGPSVHSGWNLPRAPTSSSVPSGAYLPR